MTTQEQLKAYNKHIAKRYGLGNQYLKLIEELGELTTALARIDAKNTVEELADVKDLIMQIEYLIGAEKAVEDMQKRKTTRTILRMINEEVRADENAEHRHSKA